MKELKVFSVIVMDHGNGEWYHSIQPTKRDAWDTLDKFLKKHFEDYERLVKECGKPCEWGDVGIPKRAYEILGADNHCWFNVQEFSIGGEHFDFL